MTIIRDILIMLVYNHCLFKSIEKCFSIIRVQNSEEWSSFERKIGNKWPSSKKELLAEW